MNKRLLLLVAVLLAFGALTFKAVMDHGYLGIFAFHLTSTAGLQVITDLVIVCVLAIAWMVTDARRRGRLVWPYVALTLLLGSFGPLLYLLVSVLSAERTTRNVVYTG
jgi:uncharacterized membrane protein